MRNLVQSFGEVAGHIGVPGMGVDDIYPTKIRCDHRISYQCLHCRIELLVRFGQFITCGIGAGFTETVNIHFDQLFKALGQIFHMDAGASINMRWPLFRYKSDLHTRLPSDG